MTESVASAPIVGSGRFVWHELMSRDVEASRRFYTELLGWGATTTDMGGMPYTIFDVNGEQIAGMATLPPGDTPTFWMGYASVPDADASVAKLQELGGQVYVPTMEIQDLGRFAVAADPQGAVFGPFTSVSPDSPPSVPSMGDFCWDTLMATDIPAALAFYRQVVGWEVEGEGGMTVFTKHGVQIANVEATQPGMPAAWLCHVAVADFEATVARVEGLGGKVVMPRVDVPGIGAFAVIQDPLGAFLSLFTAVAH